MEEKRKSIFTLFPNYESKFGNWYQEIEDKKNAEKDKKEEEKNKFNLIGDSKINGKANGYYFKIDGAFLGKEGQSNNIVICSDKKEYKEKDVFLYLSPIHTDFNIRDIEEIAALIYADSSIQYINEISKVANQLQFPTKKQVGNLDVQRTNYAENLQIDVFGRIRWRLRFFHIKLKSTLC